MAELATPTMPDQQDVVPADLHRHRLLAHTDPQLRALVPDPTVEAALGVAETSYAEILAEVLDAYAARPALGSRAYDVISDPADGRAVREYRHEYREITYGELHDRVKATAASLRGAGPGAVAPGDFVCIIGFGSADYVTVELACVFLGAVSVPLSGAMGRRALQDILGNTAPTLVASSVKDLASVAELVVGQSSVRSLVVFDFDPRIADDREAHDEAAARLEQAGSQARLVVLNDLVEEGQGARWVPPDVSTDPAERMALLIHSSGTTGDPKGAILTEQVARRDFTPAPAPLPLVRLSFAPLNHSAGRATVYGTLAHGGTVNFITKPDLSTFFDDIRLVRPTDGFFFPRALEMLHGKYTDAVTEHMAEGSTPADASVEALAEMRERVLGGRLCTIRVAGAPTPAHVRRFVVDGLGIGLMNSYGSTEVGPVTMNDRVTRDNVIAYRLRDVPELGYFTTDKPYPRGELCVKTKTAVKGYFKQPEATAALFDADGWVLTSDIMEERSADELVYIDRRGDVVKLAQAEFVATGALAATFETLSEVIHQIFVYGSSERSFLLAVVVPDLRAARSRIGHEPSDADLRRLIRAEFKRAAASTRLKPFEVPRDFIIEREPFSLENGLLTALRKRIRPAILGKYQARLDALYLELDRKQQGERAELQHGSADGSALETIGRALAATLGIDASDARAGLSFADLGGDSLSAIELSTLVEKIFGVELSVNAILSPSGDPVTWARRVEASLGGSSRTLPSFASVHGGDAQQLHSKDLELDVFLDDRVLARIPSEVAPCPPRTVLLTGATGFLGRFLCVEWLERLAAVPGGRLVCVVRAPDHTAALHRLEACFTGADDRLENRYKELADGRLDVVVGDIAEKALGLGDAEFARLAKDIDRIVHPAALVNHVFGYEHLFDSNVAGTASLIELALTHRLKPIDFVSSAAVWRFLDRGTRDDEESPLLPSIGVSDGYATGYGASKWAAEHLLRSASLRFGLPVNVFRGDMMLPHRLFHGQLNGDDVFTRLLYSIVVTGLAPRSFYVLGSDGARPRTHYDGLPVDFIASAIVGVGSEPHNGIATFNVTNHADDGVSLDVIVDWVESAGYRLERVASYEDWLNQFEAALRALPDDQRQMSSFDVLESLREPNIADARQPGSRRFDRALRTLDVGPEAPSITQDYINKCLDDMVRVGLLKAP